MLYLLQLLLRRTFLRQANTGAACPARQPGPGATGRLLSDNAVTLLTGTAGPVGAQGNAEMLLWSRPVFVGLFVCCGDRSILFSLFLKFFFTSVVPLLYPFPLSASFSDFNKRTANL